QAEDPISVTLMKDLEKSRRKLASAVRRGSGDKLPDRYLEEVGRARSDEERLERELAARSEIFRKERALERLGLDEVMGATPARAALVAYVQIDSGEVATNGGGRQTAVTTRPRRLYAAFTAGYRDKTPSFVPLGDAESIDAAVHRWRELAGAAPASTQAETDYRAAAEVLRKRIWDPLRPSLHDASMVIVVPDGALHLVNLGSLPAGKHRYLIETGPAIHYVSAERDLPAAAQSWKRGSGILALGGPDFDAAGPAGGDVTFASSLLRGTRAACRDFATLRFENVPNAKAEVEEVERLWKSSGRNDDARVLTGPGATETAIRELAPGKKVLHLATHGFFVEDRCDTPLARAAGGSREGTLAREEPLKGENPLLLSGLALSGANHRDEPANSGWKDDGILTAAEAASLDLRGVDWAVLSACETGIGPIQVGEGVLGLRRAFQVAGARTVIMSLWSVSDLASREWIRQLYKARLSGQSTIQSVRSASTTILEARRKAGITTHPFYWGAFVAAGDWQ
ncbi:MAG: CHAT domain-containing protein, partial [Acidobacteria bacterium]|nr:CHAT domain-containing protein [Acidobacteriota bacterium]